MAKTIAGINDYPYGVCGFIVDGALLKNGTKLKNLRIYKQRSINVFDLIDPASNVIYQKVQITGYDNTSRVLDYTKSNDELIDSIPVNSFFVRGYNSTLTQAGFVIRFMANKVVLSDGSKAYMFDMYVPECSITIPDLGAIIVNTVTVDSTSLSGSVSAASGTLNEEGMIVTLTTPSGEVFTTSVLNRMFTFDPVSFESEGTGTITVTSPHYNTAEVTFSVQPSGIDSDYVTVYPVSASQFIDNKDGTFSYVLTEQVHNRGANLVLQLQDTSGAVYTGDLSVSDSGDVTVTQMSAEDIDIVLIGDTTKEHVFVKTLSWIAEDDYFRMDIPYTEHNKQNISVSVYDGTSVSAISVLCDDEDNVTLISDTEFSGKVVIAGKA